MSHDLQMARGEVEGEINLAIGEPYFLKELFLDHLNVTPIPWRVTYPTLGGEPELVEELKKIFNYKYIVVTNGAKQAIEATYFALKRLERRSVVSHDTPHWPSYPTLAKSQSLDFNERAPRSAVIACVTAPNNPDGSQAFVHDFLYDLWDAAYAQPLYGFHGIAPLHRVAVFSAAKYLALSGLRVGWLGTNEQEIADLARYFVEITTSGVAIPSQFHVASCLRALRDPESMGSMSARGIMARDALTANGSIFHDLLGDLVESVQGVPANGAGMFAWFRAYRPKSMARAFETAKVKVVTGEACGGHPDYFRISMGQMPEVTRDALKRVRYGIHGRAR